MKPTVRRARGDDAQALARLSVQLGYASSRQQVELRLTPLLSHPEHAVFVAEVGDAGAEASGRSPEVVAWIHAFVQHLVESDLTVEIGGLVVDEAWRGRRVGRLLIEHVERWARSIGCNTVTVRSNVIRERAHGFYKGLGFTVVKTQHVFRKTIAP